MGWKHKIYGFEWKANAIDETLVGLHTTAWWSGIRLSAFGVENARFHVALIPRNNECILMEWEQGADEWIPFKWLIPADFADSALLDVKITLLTPFRHSQRVDISVKMSFQEMPRMDRAVRYAFVNSEMNTIHYHWDGERRAWGTPMRGADLSYGKTYVLIPPSSAIDTKMKIQEVRDWYID
jgi:hypothetical protein